MGKVVSLIKEKVVYNSGYKEPYFADGLNVLELRELLKNVPNEYEIMFDVGDEYYKMNVAKVTMEPEYNYLMFSVPEADRRDVCVQTLIEKTILNVLEMMEIENLKFSKDAMDILEVAKDDGLPPQDLKDVIFFRKVAIKENIKLTFDECSTIVAQTTNWVTPKFSSCNKENCPNCKKCQRYLLFLYLKSSDKLEGQTIIFPKKGVENCEIIITLDEGWQNEPRG